jgi:hypothetical protein
MTPVRGAEPRRRCDRRALAAVPRANHQPGTIRQLDAAIAALRTIVSVVASADALARLSDEVRALSLRDGREPVPALDESGRDMGRVKAIGGTLDPKILRPLVQSVLQSAGGTQSVASCEAMDSKRGGRSAAIFEKQPLLLVSITAAILVTVFITAMTMLEAV